MLALLALLASGPQVTLDAVGDVMLARWVGRRIARQGPELVLKQVRPIFRQADLVYGNLECALTDAPATAKKEIVLHADPVTLPALKGFSILSLVNNHGADCGDAGLRDAARRLRAVNILPLVPRYHFDFVECKGLRIGFVGLCDLPRYPLPTGWQNGITAMRKRCDVLIVGMHWGVEGSTAVSPAQKSWAMKLASLGVDAILGCHPHVLEPIMRLNGRNGRKCLVAYSLGNFVFDARPGPATQSEILQLRLTRSGVTSYAIRKCRIVNDYPEPVGPWS